MGNSINKDIQEACVNYDYNRFREILLNTDGGKSFDFFKLSFKSDFDEQDPVDCMSCVISSLPPDKPSVPFFKLILDQITATKNTNNGSLTTPQQKIPRCYVYRLIHKRPSDLQGFRFFLDNTETFPFAFPEDGEGVKCPIVLHQLCESKESIELLREYISSGRIEERFKNSNSSNDDNDDMKAISPFRKTTGAASTPYFYKTPLQVAIRNSNLDAVRELCVAKIGGANWHQCADQLFFRSDLDYRKFDREALSGILLTLLAQPGGASAILTHCVKSTSAVVLLPSFLRSQKEVSDPLALQSLLNIKFSKERDDLSIYIDNQADLTPTLATACLWRGGRGEMYETLISNGARQFPITKFFSQGLMDACKMGDLEVVTKILVRFKFHESVIDINRGLDGGGISPLAEAVQYGHADIVKILLDSGAEKTSEAISYANEAYKKISANNTTSSDENAVSAAKKIYDLFHPTKQQE